MGPPPRRVTARRASQGGAARRPRGKRQGAASRRGHVVTSVSRPKHHRRRLTRGHRNTARPSTGWLILAEQQVRMEDPHVAHGGEVWAASRRPLRGHQVVGGQGNDRSVGREPGMLLRTAGAGAKGLVVASAGRGWFRLVRLRAAAPEASHANVGWRASPGPPPPGCRRASAEEPTLEFRDRRTEARGLHQRARSEDCLPGAPCRQQSRTVEAVVAATGRRHARAASSAR